MIFRSSLNKDLIRRDIDLDLVRQLYESKGQQLTYFGLPGTELLDLSEWRDYLGSFTCVERSEPLMIHMLLDNAFNKGLDKDLQLMVGDIDQIMLSWKDDCGCSPRSDAFDIVNLDYVGG